MFTAFQSNAFQSNAFQINGGAATAVPTFRWIGGKEPYSYIRPHDVEQEKLHYESLSKKRLELQELENKLAINEKRQALAKARSKAKLAAQVVAAEQKKLEAELQAEIGRLRIARTVLMRWIDDEEAILVLLLSQPF